MIQKITNVGLALLILFSISSCKNDTKTKKVDLQKIPVVKVVKMDVPIFSWYVGQIYGYKDIPIRARVEGFLESIDFKEGSKVTKGQLLYTIDPQSLEAASNAQKSQVTAAQTDLSKARADLDRIKPLAEANAISKSDLDAAQAAYDAAIANLNAAKANLKSSNIDLSYTQVRSPIDGIIGKTNARVGEFVGRDPNPVILNTVSEIDSVIVKFSITEDQFIRLSRRSIQRRGDSIAEGGDFPGVVLQLADESIYDFEGEIDFVDRSINQNTGTILVQASFPNPNRLLRPGLYSKVKILTEIKKDAIIVPQRCIMELQGQFSVYIVGDSNKVVTRQVKVGYRSGDLAAITEGLSIDDKVVIDALQKVNNGTEIIPVDTIFESKVFKFKQ